MNAIAVIDENRGLGRDGRLLAHLPGDLRNFKKKTLGKTIIIGRGTFDSMSGRLLPGRETVILSQNVNFKPPCPVFRSVKETLDYIKDKKSEDIFVAGGESVYRQFFPYCDTLFITKLYASFDADRYFPDPDAASGAFIMSGTSEMMEENGIKYQFIEYKRKR